MRGRSSLGLAAAIVAVVGVACSSSGDGAATAPVSGASPGAAIQTASSDVPPASDVPPTTAAPGGATASGDDAAVLAQLYSLMNVGTEQELVVALTVGNPVEADVARCMADAGFQYAEGPSAEEEAGTDLRWSMSGEEYAATYGFGVAASELGLFPARPPDPNMSYVGSLSQGQVDAYYQTYRACSRPDPDDRFRNSNALNVALEQFRGAVDADERSVAALTAWRECVAAAGYRFDTPQAMRESFYARLPGASRADLERLLADERAAATANAPCEAAYTAERRDVITERVDEFRGLFDAAIASGAAPDGQG